MKKLWIIVWLLPGMVHAQKSNELPAYLQLQQPIFAISMVMMHDVVNPPAASRFYSYAMLGAYEIASQHQSQMVPLQKLIKQYKPIKLVAKKPYDYRIAAVYSVLEIGKRLLPSGFMLQETQDKYITTLRKNKINQAQIDAALSIANQVAQHIVEYAGSDGYKNLSAKLRYTPLKGEGYWYPTPPAYIEAVEPNWRIIRPMLIDSFNQFPPLPPVTYSKDSNSLFFKMAKEVYDISKSLTKEQLHIASFWDCNPFVVNTSGHMSIGFKKISPGGHWMNIAGIASKQAKLNFDNAVLVHTMVSLTLVDAFISCWDEKYRSNRIRPETFINKYIDLKWQPLLQTPPFPEYTSGHSVISTAAAEMLSYLLGNEFAYTDDSEDMFDIKARSFKSFKHAAEEAAISRLYGGIHFIDAIVNGQTEGKLVGLKAVEKINQVGIKAILKNQ